MHHLRTLCLLIMASEYFILGLYFVIYINVVISGCNRAHGSKIRTAVLSSCHVCHSGSFEVKLSTLNYKRFSPLMFVEGSYVLCFMTSRFDMSYVYALLMHTRTTVDCQHSPWQELTVVNKEV